MTRVQRGVAVLFSVALAACGADDANDGDCLTVCAALGGTDSECAAVCDAAGSGSDSGTNDGDAVLDAGTDTTGDGGGDTTDPTTAFCGPHAECASPADCSGYTAPACEAGCCAETAVAADCVRHDTPCTGPSATNDAFVCNDLTLRCEQRCASSLRDAVDGANCPTESLCIARGADGPIDPATGATLDGVCFVSQCDSFFEPGDPCAGVVDLAGDTCAAGECGCFPLGNDMNYCAPHGTAGAGAPCSVSTEAVPPPSDACADGLVCHAYECVVPCRLGAANTCAAGETCLDLFGATTQNPIGVCEPPCPPYSTGTCADGEVCTAHTDIWGLTGWACRPPAGAQPELAPCTPSWASWHGDCADGLVCSNEDSPSGPVCRRVCDPAATSGACADGFTCLPLTDDGNIAAICEPTCTPFPRMGTGGYADCGPNEFCYPIPLNGLPPVGEPTGICRTEAGTIPAGGACDPSAADPSCSDLSTCFGGDFDPQAVCRELCEPFDPSACGAQVCNPVPFLNGSSVGVCATDVTGGNAFEPCDRFGYPCQQDSTICLDLGSGLYCFPVCRVDLNDCAAYDATSCVDESALLGTAAGVGLCE